MSKNEKRLIDKDALIALCDAPHWCVWMSEIEDFPTVDSVEVVRCKDCFWSSFDHDEKRLYCDHPYGLNYEIKENYFCCHGER